MNWQEFFTDYQIEWVSRGPNTKRGELSVKCPFCGEDDPSQHLGVSLTSENWGCLRDPQHRGHSAARLVAALLGCPQPQAGLVVAQYSRPDPGGFDTLAALTLTSEAPSPATDLVEAKPAFSPIKPSGSTAKFWRYLENRGFDDVPALLAHYRLGCCLSGRFKDRLIIPFYQGRELIAWTGRAVPDPKQAPRYLSSNRIKETVFNEDELRAGGEVLFLVEGPFDALKLDYYSQQYGARATCCFGTSMSVDQALLLSVLQRRFQKVVVLFDRDATGPMFNAMDWIHGSHVSFALLPDGVKDPGEMTKDQVRELTNDYR